MSGQGQEERRAAVARGQAETHRRLDQLEVAQAQPAPTSSGSVTATSRAKPVFSGTSGPVAWEITAVEQTRSANGSMIRWDYEVLLRDREGRGIQFQTMEEGAEAAGTRTAPRKVPFTRRLESGGEIRFPAAYWITYGTGRTTGFGDIPGGREGVRLLLRFDGRTDTGAAARIDIRFSLDPGVGDQPRVTADATPLPVARALKADELQILAGTWTGHLSDDRGLTFALEIQVRPDGQVDAAVGTVVKQRFQGSFTISKAGELEYATRNASGPATLHGDGPQGVLTGTATPKPGASSTAVSYSFRVRSSGGSPPAILPVIAAAPMPAPSVASPVALSPTADEVLTNESILTMVKAGLDESVILAKITTTAARFDTRTDALIELKRAGVTDRVLAAMVEKRGP